MALWSYERATEATEDLYRNTTDIVRTNTEKTGKFLTKNCVKQEGILIPLLFVMVFDQMARKASKDNKRFVLGVRRLQFLYTDDLLLLAPNTKELQDAIRRWSSVMEEYSMKIN